MCGRFTLSATPLEIAERFDVPLSFLDLYEKSYNISPSHHILSMIDSGLVRRAGLLRWGLIPS